LSFTPPLLPSVNVDNPFVDAVVHAIAIVADNAFFAPPSPNTTAATFYGLNTPPKSPPH
jgi:hypothetical protein